MRKYGLLLLLVLLVWVGLWAVGSHFLKSRVEAELQAQSQGGFVARMPQVEVAGFPSRFDLNLNGPIFHDPRRDIEWQGEAVKFSAMTWKPWHILAALPPSQSLRIGSESYQVTSSEFRASLRAKPASALPLAESRLQVSDAAIQSTQGWAVQSQSFNLILREGAAPVTGAASYDLGLQAVEITLDPSWMAKIAAVELPIMPSQSLPGQISRIYLDANLPLTEALDRHYQSKRPAPLGLELRSFALEWGELKLAASGTISPDLQGYASGEIRLTVDQWQHLPVILVAAGVLPERFAPTLGNMLNAVSKTEGSTSTVSLPLLLKDGRMSFGPIPLGEAPKLRALP